MMFIVAAIVWVVECLWDLAFPKKPEETKKKSILKKAKKTDEKEKDETKKKND
jgi:hypothetical protein